MTSKSSKASLFPERNCMTAASWGADLEGSSVSLTKFSLGYRATENKDYISQPSLWKAILANGMQAGQSCGSLPGLLQVREVLASFLVFLLLQLNLVVNRAKGGGRALLPSRSQLRLRARGEVRGRGNQ